MLKSVKVSVLVESESRRSKYQQSGRGEETSGWSRQKKRRAHVSSTTRCARGAVGGCAVENDAPEQTTPREGRRTARGLTRLLKAG